MDVWAVVGELERIQWVLDPLEGVGPLRFGMSHDDVVAAVAPFLSPSFTRGGYHGAVVSSEFNLARTPSRPQVTAYYDFGRLAGVAVNALCGPQVTLEGLRLVGRVPSELEDAFAEYSALHGHDVWYSQHADPGSEAFGIVLRAQRAGDVVLSRPVFVGSAWAERCGDVTEGPIPMEEWRTW